MMHGDLFGFGLKDVKLEIIKYTGIFLRIIVAEKHKFVYTII